MYLWGDIGREGAGGLPGSGDILIPELLPLILEPKLDAESTLEKIGELVA